MGSPFFICRHRGSWAFWGVGFALSFVLPPPSWGQTPLWAPRIANGEFTDAWPAAGALLSRFDQLPQCSLTLIGCRTALTAAHCVCYSDLGQRCQPGSFNREAPENLRAFFPHGGYRDITGIQIPLNYAFAEAGDVALLTLDRPVGGVAPAPINDRGPVLPGSKGTIVGYGLRRPGDLRTLGMKSAGPVVTEDCAATGLNIADADFAEQHICWQHSPSATTANTCSGDSGGPLFVDQGFGPAVAGVTSGGTGNCDGFDTAFDSDVYINSPWIAANAGEPLGLVAGRCEGLPAAGDQSAAVLLSGARTLAVGLDDAVFALQVPTATARLILTLNGDASVDLFGSNPIDLDLYAAPGDEAPNTAPCASLGVSPFEACEVNAPSPGPWTVRVHRYRFPGSSPPLVEARYQLTVTALGGDGADLDSDGDGRPDSLEQAEGTNPNRRDNDIFTNQRWFVQQQYRDFLDREGEAGGVDHWLGQLSGGFLALEDVIVAFLLSDEFLAQVSARFPDLTTTAEIHTAALYQGMLQRDPDPDGFAFWVAEFQAGTPTQALVTQFYASAEYAQRFLP